MDASNSIILIGALLLFSSILATVASARFGFPLLLIFLGVGMLAGEDGPGGIQFDDFETAFLIGNLALAIILLDGGLRTDIRGFRVALKPALSLATIGVILTSGILGAFAVLLLGLDWRLGLLVGAIIGSTDAAAVFALLRNSGIKLNERVGSTLEIESGINDPMAIFLTLTLLEAIRLDQSLANPQILLFLLQQFGLGAVLGGAFGWLLRELLRRISLTEGLYPLLIASGGLLAFTIINELGGSGFLGVYLTGLIIGTARNRGTYHVLRVMDGLAWLAQAGMFLILGLLVTPSAVMDQLWPSFALALLLLLVGRPIAVWFSLLPFHFNWREILFMAWVGLRGAVPIVLALFPLMYGIDGAARFFEVAYVVVIVSLLIQGSSVSLAARLLKVEVPRSVEPRHRAHLDLPIEPLLEMVQFDVTTHADAIGRSPEAIPHAGAAQIAGVLRRGAMRTPGPEFTFQSGDIVCLMVSEDLIPDLSAFFSGPARKPHTLDARRFFGDFSIEGHVRLDDLGQAYGVALPDPLHGLTLDAAIKRILPNPPVVGDSVQFGKLRLTVREMDGANIVLVGLKLDVS
ncbi:MAG: potassium/proton antiporter [Thiotrichales bacterium]